MALSLMHFGVIKHPLRYKLHLHPYCSCMDTIYTQDKKQDSLKHAASYGGLWRVFCSGCVIPDRHSPDAGVTQQLPLSQQLHRKEWLQWRQLCRPQPRQGLRLGRSLPCQRQL